MKLATLRVQLVSHPLIARRGRADVRQRECQHGPTKRAGDAPEPATGRAGDGGVLSTAGMPHRCLREWLALAASVAAEFPFGSGMGIWNLSSRQTHKRYFAWIRC